jgi:hypothetical protein
MGVAHTVSDGDCAHMQPMSLIRTLFDICNLRCKRCTAFCTNSYKTLAASDGGHGVCVLTALRPGGCSCALRDGAKQTCLAGQGPGNSTPLVEAVHGAGHAWAGCGGDEEGGQLEARHAHCRQKKSIVVNGMIRVGPILSSSYNAWKPGRPTAGRTTAVQQQQCQGAHDYGMPHPMLIILQASAGDYGR